MVWTNGTDEKGQEAKAGNGSKGKKNQGTTTQIYMTDIEEIARKNGRV